MGTIATTATDLWRLAAQARERGLKLYAIPATGEWYCTSISDPNLLHRVTGFSCDCKGFMAWQRCTHHALLLAELGWLPDLDDDPPPTVAAEVVTVQEPTPAPAVSRPAQLVRFPDPATRLEAMATTIEQALATLAGQLAAGPSPALLAFLRFFAGFRSYSWQNVLLIHVQRPDATLVAGMTTWNRKGCRIKKGERGIWIWRPLVRKAVDSEMDEPAERVVGFAPALVFDVSQLANLDERPLPTFFAALPDDARELLALVRDRIVAHGIRVVEEALPPGVQGASRGGTIVLRAGLDSRNALLTLVHEWIHEIGHQGSEQGVRSRAVEEFEAESVAFVVAAALGIAHPTAADYLWSWHGDAQQLRASLDRIQFLSRMALAIIDDHVADPAATGIAA